MNRTRAERIRSARESVMRLAKEEEKAWHIVGTKWNHVHPRLHRAVAYLNKLEAKR